MKHFSYFIQPGFKRVAAGCSDTNVLVSAYLSPDSLRLVVVFINRSAGSSTVSLDFSTFPDFNSSVYQTAGANKFQFLGSAGSQLALPGSSLTTVVLDKFIAVGDASNPVPANNATDVAFDATLNWTPGSNAVTHAVYLGFSSNAVVQASPASTEFKGFVTNSALNPGILFGSTTYFWRVDEIAGANTNVGTVWSFSTAAGTSLIHRYSFSEASGTNVADSVGGPSWNGTLPRGGTFSSGELVLSSNAQQYVNLPIGILSNLTSVTLEFWATFQAGLPASASFFSFGNSNSLNNGTHVSCLPGAGRFAVTSAGLFGEVSAYTPGFNWSGKTLHIACVVDPAAHYIAIYTNGVLAGTNNSGAYTLNSLINKFSYINRSLSSSDPYVNLTLDEFRIYNAALTAPEIAATEALGPNQLLSTDSPALSLTATQTDLTLAWPVGSAGFKVQSRTNLIEGDWVNVTSPAPQIIGGQWQMSVPLTENADSTFYRLLK
jgi:hypothetical protein